MTSHFAAIVPRDRPIEVRTVEEGLWVRVRWNEKAGHFDVVEGDGFWFEPDEVEAWREAAQPAIGIGTPRGQG